MAEITQEDIEKTREIYELIIHRAGIKLQIERPNFKWDKAWLAYWDSDGIVVGFEKWYQYDSDLDDVLIKEYELLLTEQEFRQIAIDKINIKIEAENRKKAAEQERQAAWKLESERRTYERLKEKFGNANPD